MTDTGTGMPPETLDRVFEPFFTTKEVRHGTGLGLAIVYGTARAAGGTVLVESEEGVGTTVRLCFPRSDEAASSEVEQTAELRPPRGALNLLVVEDEDGVRRVLDPDPHPARPRGAHRGQSRRCARARERRSGD